MREWIAGWIETLRIRFFEPELYRQLTQPLNEDDFGEVQRPGTGENDITIGQMDPNGIYVPEVLEDVKGHHETDTDHEETTPGS